jgi:hypothetical protein
MNDLFHNNLKVDNFDIVNHNMVDYIKYFINIISMFLITFIGLEASN